MMMVLLPLWWISQRGPPAIRGNRRRLIDTDPSAEQQLILYRSEREHLLIPHNPFITRARGPHGLVRAINTIFILLDGKTNVARAPHQRPQLSHSFLDNTLLCAPFRFRTLWFRRLFCFHCTYFKVCFRYCHSRLLINVANILCFRKRSCTPIWWTLNQYVTDMILLFKNDERKNIKS